MKIGTQIFTLIPMLIFRYFANTYADICKWNELDDDEKALIEKKPITAATLS